MLYSLLTNPANFILSDSEYCYHYYSVLCQFLQIHVYGHKFIQKIHKKKHFQYLRIFIFSYIFQFFFLLNNNLDYYEH